MKKVINQTCNVLGALAMTIAVACNSQNTANSNTSQVNADTVAMSCVPDVGLSTGAKILFACTKTNLTVKDRNAIFEMCGFHAANDSVLYEKGDLEYLTGTEEDISLQLYTEAYIYDLNKDGVDEVLIEYSSSMYGGTAGNPCMLFTKGQDGKLKICLSSYSTGGLEVLESSTLGWSDLVFGGGLNHVGMWKWNGKKYAFAKELHE